MKLPVPQAPCVAQALSVRSAAPIVALACTLVSGCSDGTSAEPLDGGGGGLPGTVLADDGAATRLSGVLYAIDPGTGEVREHAVAMPDRSDDSRYSSSSAFSVGGSGDDGTLLLSVTDCVPPLSSDSCIERVNPDGTIERLFTLPLWIQAPAVASPDGTLVAALVSPGRVDGPYDLNLYTPSGELIDSQTLSRTLDDFALYDWAPGNRLVYGLNEEGEGAFIAIAAPESLAPEEGFQVSDPSATLGAISVSPDGGSVAYELIPRDGVDNTTTWVLDRSDGRSTLVAVDDGREVFAPDWSPDGRYLLVSYGVSDTAAGGASPVGSTLPFQMVVEWSGETVTLDPYEGVGRVLDVDDSTVSGTPDGDRWTFGRPFWVR